MSVSWHLKSLATPLFVWKLVQTKNKENIKVPYHRPFVMAIHQSLVVSNHWGPVMHQPLTGSLRINFTEIWIKIQQLWLKEINSKWCVKNSSHFASASMSKWDTTTQFESSNQSINTETLGIHCFQIHSKRTFSTNDLHNTWLRIHSLIMAVIWRMTHPSILTLSSGLAGSGRKMKALIYGAVAISIARRQSTVNKYNQGKHTEVRRRYLRGNRHNDWYAYDERVWRSCHECLWVLSCYLMRWCAMKPT